MLERFMAWLLGSLGEYWYGSVEFDLDDEESS